MLFLNDSAIKALTPQPPLSLRQLELAVRIKAIVFFM